VLRRVEGARPAVLIHAERDEGEQRPEDHRRLHHAVVVELAKELSAADAPLVELRLVDLGRRRRRRRGEEREGEGRRGGKRDEREGMREERGGKREERGGGGRGDEGGEEEGGRRMEQGGGMRDEREGRGGRREERRGRGEK